MISAEDAAIIKGMLARGDKQQWIVAWFGGDFNHGRVSNIKTGHEEGARYVNVKPAPVSQLPPIGPYVSGRSAHRALVALKPVQAAIERAIRDLTVMDNE